MTTTTEPAERLRENEIRPDHLREGQRAALQRDLEWMRAKRDRFRPARCPACGGSGATPRFEKDGFTWDECAGGSGARGDGCGTVYMSPRPPAALLAEYYERSELYAYWAKHVFPASETARREKIHAPRLDRIVEACDDRGVDRGTIIEVGAGYGSFVAVAAARSAFRRIIAVEPTVRRSAASPPAAVEWIARRIETIKPDALPPADVVVSFEVIEHLLEPRDFVESCAARLRPGGLLILTCPNVAGFEIEVLQAAAPAVQVEHVNLFRPSSLSAMVERAGLEVRELSTPGRLDVELVRRAALRGDVSLDGMPFVERIAVSEWERLGDAFQAFLAEHGLSSHLWLIAEKT